MIPNYPFARIEKLDINNGYGYGINRGLQSAKGLYVGWTHADMQTDPNDLLRGLEIIESFKRDSKIFVKGKRNGKVLDNFFTVGMSISKAPYFLPLFGILMLNQIYFIEICLNLMIHLQMIFLLTYFIIFSCEKEI